MDVCEYPPVQRAHVRRASLVVASQRAAHQLPMQLHGILWGCSWHRVGRFRRRAYTDVTQFSSFQRDTLLSHTVSRRKSKRASNHSKRIPFGCSSRCGMASGPEAKIRPGMWSDTHSTSPWQRVVLRREERSCVAVRSETGQHQERPVCLAYISPRRHDTRCICPRQKRGYFHPARKRTAAPCVSGNRFSP